MTNPAFWRVVRRALLMIVREIEKMLKPIDESLLEAFPVSKLASDPRADRNVPEVMRPEKAKQQTLF